MDAIQSVGILITLAMLALSSLYDLRSRRVPLGLTLAGLIVGAGSSISQHIWSPLLVCLGLIIGSDLKSRQLRLIYAGTLTAISAVLQPGSALSSGVLLVTWTLWEYGQLGGADAKFLMAVNLLYGNPSVLIPIALAGGFQGLIARLRAQREIPFVVSIFSGTLLYELAQLIDH